MRYEFEDEDNPGMTVDGRVIEHLSSEELAELRGIDPDDLHEPHSPMIKGRHLSPKQLDLVAKILVEVAAMPPPQRARFRVWLREQIQSDLSTCR